MVLGQKHGTNYLPYTGHGSHLEVKLPCSVCVFKVRMIYIS